MSASDLNLLGTLLSFVCWFAVLVFSFGAAAQPVKPMSARSAIRRHRHRQQRTRITVTR